MKLLEKRLFGVKIKRYLANFGLCVLLLLAYLAFFAACWYVRVFGNTGFDSVLFTLSAGLDGVGTGLMENFVYGAAVPAAVMTALTALILLQPKAWRRWISVSISLVLSLCLLVHAAFRVDLVDYIRNQFRTTQLYEDHYVDPNSVQITFPEEKRNLIYIYLESMETSYLSKELGGALEHNLILELTQLAKENINFSHNKSVGGFRQVTGASWTVGAMVAHTGGVPLKVPAGIDDWQNGYGKNGEFLDGLTTLTSILQEEGYYQTLMVGSIVSFGGRDTFYKNHGLDRIFDLTSARRDGTVASNYWNGWWGFEDEILYEYAKQQLTDISQKDQPFAFTMLTVDTHHIGGYTCRLCGSNYEENYENAIACASRQVYDFVQWIMQQDFYENTTVVITGDHCSMDNGYFVRNVEGSYTRHVYNCFINAAAKPLRTQNREFCAMDMFPTTLAAMGCTIGGNRLGLGTNLFSNLPTLMEKIGYDKLCDALSQQSEYYDDHFYSKREQEAED